MRATHSGSEEANKNSSGLMSEMGAMHVMGFHVYLPPNCVNNLSLYKGARLGHTTYLVSYHCEFVKRLIRKGTTGVCHFHKLYIVI